MIKGLTPQPEVTNPEYSMYDDGGVEVEVGEFLYGLVRILKHHIKIFVVEHRHIVMPGYNNRSHDCILAMELPSTLGRSLCPLLSK